MPRPANPKTPEGRVLTDAIEVMGLGAMARLAEKMEVTPGLISQFANGHRPVPWDRAEKLAKEVGVSARDISAEFKRVSDYFSASQLRRLDADMILASYRDAVIKVESQGLSAKAFRPLKDPDHAELLALAIIGRMTPAPPDSGIPVKVEVGRGSERKDRKGSGTAGKDRQAEAGGEGRIAASNRAKRKA